MNYATLPLMSGMHAKMRYLGERQAVLAQNIANVDTPDYKAKDIKAPDFTAHVMRASKNLPMARTNTMHMASAQNMGGIYKMTERKPTYETNPNGNTVSMEEEIQKVAMTAAQYSQMTGLYRKTIEMFRTAAGRPGGG